MGDGGGGAHTPLLCTTVAGMAWPGQYNSYEEEHRNTPIDQAMGHPSLVLACTCHLGSFLVLFARALATTLVLSGGRPVDLLTVPCTSCILVPQLSALILRQGDFFTFYLAPLPVCCLHLPWLPAFQFLGLLGGFCPQQEDHLLLPSCR